MTVPIDTVVALTADNTLSWSFCSYFLLSSGLLWKGSIDCRRWKWIECDDKLYAWCSTFSYLVSLGLQHRYIISFYYIFTELNKVPDHLFLYRAFDCRKTLSRRACSRSGKCSKLIFTKLTMNSANIMFDLH